MKVRYMINVHGSMTYANDGIELDSLVEKLLHANMIPAEDINITVQLVVTR